MRTVIEEQAQTQTQTNSFAEKNWYYQFREINSVFNEKRCKKIAKNLLNQYLKITVHWDKEKNSEWICRFFMAAKLITVATSHINSANIVHERNLLITASHLRYEAIVFQSRAICYTLPEHKWKNGKIIEISSNDAIKWTLEYLQKFDNELAESIETTIKRLKHNRDLISYDAHSLDKTTSKSDIFLSLCTLLAEVAQFNSELLEEALFEHGNYANSEFELLQKYLDKISVKTKGFSEGDDNYQLGSIASKYPQPRNLMNLMTKSYIDDSMRWWLQKDDFNDSYNHTLHKNRQIIFDIA